MSGVKLTPEDIILDKWNSQSGLARSPSLMPPVTEEAILSRWDSQGRLSKIISVGLILVYVLGLVYSSIMPFSSETCRLFLLWPGVIVYVVVSYWLAVVIISFVSFRKRAHRKKAIYVLLPSLIITFYFRFVFAMESLISDAEEGGNREMTQIYNPVTGKNYGVRQKSSKFGKKGKIEGLWGSSQEKTETNENGDENNGED